MRGCMQTLVIVAALLLFLAAGAFWLLTRQPVAAQQLTPMVVSTAAAQHFDQKIATIRAAQAPVTIEITEQEATSKLVTLLAETPDAPPITDPQVRFREGQFIAQGVMRGGPVPITIAVTGHLELQNGQLVTVVDQIDTGRLPLPEAMQQQIISLVSGSNQLATQVPLNLTAVELHEGRLVLSGTPK